MTKVSNHTPLPLFQFSLLNMLESDLYDSTKAFFVVDPNRNVRYWSEGCAQLTGLSSEDVIGTNRYRSAFYQDDHPCLVDLVLDGCTELNKNLYTKLEICKNGRSTLYAEEWIFIQNKSKFVGIKASPIFNEQQEVVAAVETICDLTEVKMEKLRGGIAEKVLENSLEGVFIVNHKGQIIWVNQAFQNITGFKAEETLGKNPSILSSGKHDKTFYQNMWKSIIVEGKWQGEIWDRRKNGEIYPQWVSIVMVPDPETGHSIYVSVFSDIAATKQGMQIKQMEKLAYYDNLTGLPNRLFLVNTLSNLLKEENTDTSIYLLFLDLDGFKLINDTLGHSFGDRCLCLLAKEIQTCIHSHGWVSRMGGDEFVIVLPSKNKTEVSEIAGLILNRVSRPFTIDEHELMLTASIGISVFPQDGADLDTLIKNADIAMYSAKAKGKNKWQFYSMEMNMKNLERMAIGKSLLKALKQNEFEIYYQPIVDANTNQIARLEALLRWNHPERRISPDQFIPIAVEMGLISRIDEWVLKAVCQQLYEWLRKGIWVRSSVNVSPFFLQQASVMEKTREIFCQYPIEPSQITFEITENALMNQLESNIMVIRELKKFGIRISIDDFGTGYSSLGYIKDFPVDEIKIDKVFVRDIHLNTKDQAIAKAVITLSRSLGLLVVAEGIETLEQAEFLTQLTCNKLQGYFYGKPMPSYEIEKELNKKW